MQFWGTGTLFPYVTLGETRSRAAPDTGGALTTTAPPGTSNFTNTLGDAPVDKESYKQRVEFLNAQIDSLAGEVLLRIFVVASGSQNRRQGGMYNERALDVGSLSVEILF